MEMYGVIDGETSETQQGFIDPLDVRSSYSLGKRAAELLCKSYNSEYSIPTINVRLAMCFGPGIPLNDNRVCKYCCDQAIKSESIILKSSGKTRLNFCYTADAARGIFLLLQKGIDGEAYNLCNNYEQYDIAKMAQTIASFNNSEVIIENSSEKTGFAPDNTMILLNDKIRKLGWTPQNNTEQALRKTYEYIKEENE
jgi:dTDP-glucose 4,6-dehydratase